MDGRASGRRLGREVGLASVLGIGLAVAMTWPSALHPATTVPSDLFDPMFQVWQVAWGGHALLHQPLHPFNANAFWPLHDSLAFTDSLLGYAPMGALGAGPVAALVHYNLLFIFADAFASFGGYLLARQLGMRPIAACVTGVAYAYAPWRIAHAGHLNILSSGAIPLALAMLARGHGIGLRGRSGPYRPRWVILGWVVAAWQLTLGFAIGLPFAYAMGAGALVGGLVWLFAGRPALPRRLLVAEIAGMAVFVLVGLAMAVPYLSVAHAHPEALRGPAWVRLYSPPWIGWFLVPAHELALGGWEAVARSRLVWAPEMTLSPGFVVTGLATAGALIAPWSRRRRLFLVAVAFLAVVFGSGTSFFGGKWTFLFLVAHFPGWQGLRVPGRIVLYLSLALGLLAAGALESLARSLRPRWRVAVPLLLVLAVLVEGMADLPHPHPSPPPAVMATLPGPLLVLPSDDYNDATAMYWSTAGFPRLVNGSSGFDPTSLTILRNRVASFPDAASVSYLRRLGVRSVMLVLNRVAGTPWANAPARPTAGLGLSVRRVDGTVVYSLG